MAEEEKVNREPDNTSSGRTVVSQRSPRAWGSDFASVFKHANKPLPVTVIGGLIVLFVTNYVQDRYWLAQQRFLLDQARMNRMWEGSLAALDEIGKAVQKRLAASALLIDAYGNGFEYTQLLQSVKQYNQRIDEWDDARQTIKLRLATYFPDPKVGEQWQRLRDDIVELKEGVSQLSEVASRTSARESQVAICRKFLDKSDADADTLTQSMIAYAESRIAPPKAEHSAALPSH